MGIHLAICLCIYVSIYLYTYLYLYLSTHISIYLSIYLPIRGVVEARVVRLQLLACVQSRRSEPIQIRHLHIYIHTYI
jgi:hypothetical protein